MSAPPGPYPPVAFHFSVSFGAQSQDTDCSFREVGGIGPELETEAVTEGGENRFVYQLPKAVKHPRLVLKRGVAVFGSMLVTWCKDVLELGLSTPIAPKLVHVYLRDAAALPLRHWSFHNAFPVKWEVDPFQSTRNEVALEKLEFSYAYSTREL